MALKPLRPCAHIDCGVLTREVYCPKHKPKDREQRSADAAKWHKWYGLPVFRRLRASQLVKEPFCRVCAARHIRTMATDVDHIVAHRGNWALFVDPDNLQSLCHSCHSRKTAAEVRERDSDRRKTR